MTSAGQSGTELPADFTLLGRLGSGTSGPIASATASNAPPGSGSDSGSTGVGPRDNACRQVTRTGPRAMSGARTGLARASALVALMLALAGCGSTSQQTKQISGPPIGNRSSATAAPNSGTTEPTGMRLPSTLRTGTIHVVIAGTAPQTFDLKQVGPTVGVPVGADIGPGYNFYADDGNKVVLRLPPTGAVGTVLTDGSLRSPVEVEFQLQNPTRIFDSGDVAGSCPTTLTQVSATALGGTISCQGLKDKQSQATADFTATFSLST